MQRRRFYLATSFSFLEWVICPAWAVPMDVGGRFSGTVTGVMNMAGALAASFTPIVYGTLFGRGHWVAPFLVSAAVKAAGALIWMFLIDPEKSVPASAVRDGQSLSVVGHVLHTSPASRCSLWSGWHRRRRSRSELQRQVA